MEAELDTPRLADDLLEGIEAIAHEVGLKPRRIHYMLSQGALPGRKVGGKWYSRRSELERFFSAELGCDE